MFPIIKRQELEPVDEDTSYSEIDDVDHNDSEYYESDFSAEFQTDEEDDDNDEVDGGEGDDERTVEDTRSDHGSRDGPRHKGVRKPSETVDLGYCIGKTVLHAASSFGRRQTFRHKAAQIFSDLVVRVASRCSPAWRRHVSYGLRHEPLVMTSRNHVAHICYVPLRRPTSPGAFQCHTVSPFSPSVRVRMSRKFSNEERRVVTAEWSDCVEDDVMSPRKVLRWFNKGLKEVATLLREEGEGNISHVIHPNGTLSLVARMRADSDVKPPEAEVMYELVVTFVPVLEWLPTPLHLVTLPSDPSPTFTAIRHKLATFMAKAATEGLPCLAVSIDDVTPCSWGLSLVRLEERVMTSLGGGVKQSLMDRVWLVLRVLQNNPSLELPALQDRIVLNVYLQELKKLRGREVQTKKMLMLVLRSLKEAMTSHFLRCFLLPSVNVMQGVDHVDADVTATTLAFLIEEFQKSPFRFILLAEQVLGKLCRRKLGRKKRQ